MSFRDVANDFKKAWVKHKLRREIIHTKDLIQACYGKNSGYNSCGLIPVPVDELPDIIFKKHRFERVVIGKEGQLWHLRAPIFEQQYNYYEVQQTMGCYKTGIIMEHLARIHERGGVTGANFGIKWFPKNIGLVKNKWRPNVNSFDDFQKAHDITIGFDDVKGTIESVNGESAKLGSMIVNESRKLRKDILISTQRTTNFIPPNIRAVVTNYEIPIITVRDKRLPSPDGMGYPLEVEILNVSGHYTFLGFGITDGGDGLPDGNRINPRKTLLDAYSTEEIATDLKQGKSEGDISIEMNTEREPYSGYNHEMEVVRELYQLRNGIVHHISKDSPQRHIGDIEYLNGKKWMIDVVAVIQETARSRYPMLQTFQKDINMFITENQKMGYIPIIAFKLRKDVRFLKAELLAGKKGNIRLSKELKAAHLPAKGAFALF